jgi:hypothetical protein
MKIAKVISTCFRRGRVRMNTTLTGNPLGFFSHSQNFTTVKETINLLKYQIEMESKFKPGIDRDIIIVNSDIGNAEGNNFLSQINHLEIINGKVISFNRRNIGMSYGGFNDAFIKFKNKYDFFLFLEDDLITAKNNYLRIGLDKWRSTPNCGFVAYIGLSKVAKYWWKKADLKKNIDIAYSGCVLASSKVLNEIIKKNGRLPYYNGNDHKNSIARGEIQFSKCFSDLGYSLAELKNEILIIPAYDLMRNINYRKYPNFSEKIFHIFKNIIYFLMSKNSSILKYYLIFLKKIR